MDMHLLGGDAEIAKMPQFHLISVKYQIGQNNIFDTPGAPTPNKS
jgi:hypothetical protein